MPDELHLRLLAYRAGLRYCAVEPTQASPPDGVGSEVKLYRHMPREPVRGFPARVFAPGPPRGFYVGKDPVTIRSLDVYTNAIRWHSGTCRHFPCTHALDSNFALCGPGAKLRGHTNICWKAIVSWTWSWPGNWIRHPFLFILFHTAESCSSRQWGPTSSSSGGPWTPPCSSQRTTLSGSTSSPGYTRRRFSPYLRPCADRSPPACRMQKAPLSSGPRT